MNRDTIEALNRLNREFYERHAEAFQTKRSRPWPGWERLLELFRSTVLEDPTRSKCDGHVPTILDAGCGHGRFAAFLDEQHPGPIDYLGIDSSYPLLEAAASRFTNTESRIWRFTQADLLADGDWLHLPAPDRASTKSPPNDRTPPPEPDGAVAGPPPSDLKRPGEGARTGRTQSPGGGPATAPIRRPKRDKGPFDLITALGLLHHLPALSERHRLLHHLAERLAPGGLLALSFWQFGNNPRFDRRLIPWDEHNRRAPEPIDPAELEDGDVLLAWGELGEGKTALSRAPRRYCHFTPPEEARALAATLDLETVAEFRADGREGNLNLYLVLRRG